MEIGLPIKKTEWKKNYLLRDNVSIAVTRIRTGVSSATTKGTNHYTITAIEEMKFSVLQ